MPPPCDHYFVIYEQPLNLMVTAPHCTASVSHSPNPSVQNILNKLKHTLCTKWKWILKFPTPASICKRESRQNLLKFSCSLELYRKNPSLSQRFYLERTGPSGSPALNSYIRCLPGESVCFYIYFLYTDMKKVLIIHAFNILAWWNSLYMI